MTKEVPLVIGVTGHRDLVASEIPALREATKELFELLQSRYPGLPLAVMSPLAEGADQLVAEVALSMSIPVTAVLPMPLSVYASDFSESASIEFHELLNQCDVIELPLISDYSEETISQRGSARDQHYVNMGAYLAAHSHLLFAIWDGKASHWPGGTSKVISFHQHDTMNELQDADRLSPINFFEDESDLVFHLSCSRQSGEQLPLTEVAQGRWLTRDSIEPVTTNLPTRYDMVFERLVELNADLKTVNEPESVNLLPTSEFSGLSETLRNLGILQSKADDLARRFQYRMFVCLNTAFVLVLLAGLSFIAYADIFSDERMIYAYLSLVAMILLIFLWERKSGWRRKYLDYRVLAEALRVQFYWSLAGLTSSEQYRYCHDSFHERRDLELGWIRNVMRFSGQQIDASPIKDEHSLDLAITQWIGSENGGQRQYYLSKYQLRQRRQALTRILETAVFFLVIAMAVALVYLPMQERGENLLIAAIGLLPFILAVRQNYAHQTAERELITQYSYYYRLFSNAHRLIEHSENSERKRHILRAAAEAALDETSQWILRQRERPRSGSMIGA